MIFTRSSKFIFCVLGVVFLCCLSVCVTFGQSSLLLKKLESTNGGQGIELDFLGYTYDVEYTVEQGEKNQSGNYTWTPLATKAKNGTYSFSGIDDSKTFCYRISSSGSGSLSNVVCEIGIEAQATSSNSARIEWVFPDSPSGNAQQLQLKREELPTGSLTNEPLTTLQDTEFNDGGLDCAKQYNYTVEMSFPAPPDWAGHAIRVISDAVLVDPSAAASQIVPKGILQVSYEPTNPNVVNLEVLHSSVEPLYRYFKKAPGEANFNQIGGDEGVQYQDAVLDPDLGKYCYKYQYKDACGNFSDLSEEFCTVFLDSDAGVANWSTLTFPASSDVLGDPSYTLEVLDPVTGSLIGSETTSNLSFSLANLIANSAEPKIVIRILVRQELKRLGQQYSTEYQFYSNTKEVNIPALVFVATAFTPNNDGKNDLFEIKTKFVQSGEIRIYDSWGKPIFKGGLLSDFWDGRDSRGSLVPVGSYSYRITGVSSAGEAFQKQGLITILR